MLSIILRLSPIVSILCVVSRKDSGVIFQENPNTKADGISPTTTVDPCAASDDGQGGFDLGGAGLIKPPPTTGHVTGKVKNSDQSHKDDASTSTMNPLETASYDYVWDKWKLSQTDYQQSLCSKRCLHGRKTELSYGVHDEPKMDFLCFPCNCDKGKCKKYGTCCPDVSERFHKLTVRKRSRPSLSSATKKKCDNDIKVGVTENNDDKKDCASGEEEKREKINDKNKKVTKVEDGEEITQLFCDEDNTTKKMYLVIRSCPSDYWDEKTKRLCEGRLPTGEMTRKTFVRVIDTQSNVVYFNDYCAQCHQVGEVTMWDLQIKCQSFLSVYSALDQDEFLRLSLKENSTCEQIQSPPTELSWKLEECTLNGTWFRNPISNCNESGLWTQYDHEVEDACLYMDDVIIHRAMLKATLYKNVFCMECNVDGHTRKPTTNEKESVIIRKKEMPPPPYSLLLGFGDRQHSSTAYGSSCGENEWEGPDNSCWPLQCTDGKSLQDRKCVSNLDRIRGLPYHVNIWLRLNDNETSMTNETEPLASETPVADVVKQTVANYVGELWAPLVSDFKLHIVILRNDTHLGYNACDRERSSVHMLDTFQYAYISALLEARFELTRDDFEDELLAVLRRSKIPIPLILGRIKYYQPFVTEGEYLQDKTACDHLKRRGYLRDMLCYHQEITKSNIYSRNEEFDHNKFLFVHDQLSCPYVVVNKSNARVEDEKPFVPWARKIFLNFSDIQIELSGGSELNQARVNKNGSIQICRQLMDSKISDYVNKPTSNPMSLVLLVETIVCSAISFICLAFTLMTYFLFPSLRCLAGINNMFLCGSLIMAQSLLLAVTYMPTSHVLCTVVGILVHFLWLAEFSWSFLCCFHMFRVFTAPTRPQHGNTVSRAAVLKRFLGSLVMPVVVVGTVILTSLLTSQWERMGYGRSACYLDSAYILATIVPVGFVTLVNIVLFVIVVVKIWRIRSLQTSDSAKRDNRRDLVIYVKLSTLTGMFWILLLLSEAVDSDPVRIIAVALNGCQGVFIFLSYTCNQRVYKLYKGKVKFAANDKLNSTDSRLTTSSMRTS